MGQNYYCYFMPKIIRILSKDHVPWRCFVNFLLKLNFLFAICIAKNLIWTTLKAIFSIFRFFLRPQIPDLCIFVSRPNIVLSQETIHQWEAYLFSFRMRSKCQFPKIDPYDWFCGPGVTLFYTFNTLLLLLLLCKLSIILIYALSAKISLDVTQKT